MTAQEKRLRELLRANGYALKRKDNGYLVRDQQTNTIYLGGNTPVTLDAVLAFVDTLDERGISSRHGYVAEEEDSLAEQAMDELEMEITNLSRYRETLLLEGKQAQASKLDEKISELEEQLADDQAHYALEKKLRDFFESRGCRLEIGHYGYRVVEEKSGKIRLAKNCDAMLEDVAEFAKSIGMEQPE